MNTRVFFLCFQKTATGRRGSGGDRPAGAAAHHAETLYFLFFVSVLHSPAYPLSNLKPQNPKQQSIGPRSIKTTREDKNHLWIQICDLCVMLLICVPVS
jgi:hypothetical protein